MAPVHDFGRKLRQEACLPGLRDYIAWRRAVADARDRGQPEPAMPRGAPLSINLDLTTACNYACDHCIDWDTLNSGISYDDERLRASLRTMAGAGLRSVILIGGGEPTVYPGFVSLVRFLKTLGLQVAVVSNGSRNERILEVADCLDEKDWVRLSLDAGTDATFQAMHRPKKAVTLEEICGWIPRIKSRNPRPRLGFSFVITWRGAMRGAEAAVVENLGEIPVAAELARRYRFDYISFKPFLVRTEEGAEVMDPASAREAQAHVVARIREAVDRAKAIETPAFEVVESINLRLLEAGNWRDATRQPSTCHMQRFRQVLSPLGLYNCPAHRGVEKARIAGRDAHAGPEAADATGRATAAILDRFDASVECRDVTCLYNETNWWIEKAVEDERGGADLESAPGEDYFL
ncbi:MAG: radical SAM protein [Planctomycetota bacterium]